MVVVNNNGHINFANSPKQLIELLENKLVQEKLFFIVIILAIILFNNFL